MTDSSSSEWLKFEAMKRGVCSWHPQQPLASRSQAPTPPGQWGLWPSSFERAMANY